MGRITDSCRYGGAGKQEPDCAPAVFAGAVSPVDLAWTNVAAVAGMNFSAIAEVYSSTVDAEGAPLVIRAVAGAGPVWPGEETGDLVDGMTVPEPLGHSVVRGPNDVGDSYVDIVTDSEPIEHLVAVRGPHDVGNSSVDVMAVPDLIEHSGVREIADPPSVVQSMLNSAGPHV